MSNETFLGLPISLIYNDLFSPSVKTIGGSLEKIIKIVLTPLDYLVIPLTYNLDKYKEKFKITMTKVAEKISPEDIYEGNTQLIVSQIQSMPSYFFADPIIQELYTTFFASCINKNKTHLAHPAFPIIYAQLARDEVIFLWCLKQKPFNLNQTAEYNLQNNRFGARQEIQNDLIQEFGNLFMHKDLLWFYNNHLHALNLSGCWEIKQQEPLFNTQTREQTGVNIFSQFKLTEFGDKFVEACISNEFKVPPIQK